jgi:hypothetical protein
MTEIDADVSQADTERSGFFSEDRSRLFASSVLDTVDSASVAKCHRTPFSGSQQNIVADCLCCSCGLFSSNHRT